MVERKASLANPSINIVYPNRGNHDCSAIMKGMEIIISIQVCLISQTNINYRENSGMKSFSCKSKASVSISQWGKHDCSAHYQKNGDYNECPSLSHFKDEP